MSGARRPIRVGFIGAGWWATVNHMPVLAAREDVELVGVCRPGAGLLAQVKDAFGFSFATEDYRELLELDLDAVIVSSPHHLHYKHTRAALERGLHVLCEKPMTLHAHEAWELVDLADRSERVLLVAYGWHYKAFVAQARALVPEIGEIEYALCHMASPTKDFFSGAGSVPAAWEPTLIAPDPRTWQTPETGGGYAHGQITHSSAMLLWVTGLRARRVLALMTGPAAPVDLYDAACVEFDNGAIGVISGAATLPDDDKFQVDIRVFGTEGVLLLDVERERVELRRHDGHHESIAIPPGEGAYSCEGPPNRFVDLTAGRGENESPGWVAARSVELIEAMQASAAEGGAAKLVA
jgi:predicted dehydrogenase